MVLVTVNCSTLLYPGTPLAFLPPDVASQLHVARPIASASLGVFVWDIIFNLPSDYKLLFKHRITVPTIVYLITSFAYVIISVVFEWAGNCQALATAFSICFAIAIPLTSLLFFFRIRAVFNDRTLVVSIFAFLWVSLLAGYIVPFGITADNIGPTQFCLVAGVKQYNAAGIVISTVNDTLVFVAISLRILCNPAIDDNVRARVKVFSNGGTLPKLSKSIFQSGQQYYLITVGGNILTMVMILTPSVNPMYRAMFNVPNIVIENCMACKVFRDIKFGIIETSATSVFRRSTIWNAKSNLGSSHTPPDTVFPMTLTRLRSIPSRLACNPRPRETNWVQSCRIYRSPYNLYISVRRTPKLIILGCGNNY
ncbi:uncharacterized protein FOMMEDRAFT_160065 [Fomitiporia mediterranea MF3/22]|uniref:uncharacterized protein n=1 Tax=Fomitiporia mediterranea (strain MF3/22) TaxID=694068 RepID=UPI0004407669|nr:uncharacterized protein FOMMEDRAFT_160065 [Fomitiporia mediterranea MF3/22]EJC99639.1 hypothetical protein FOMMEDRAFT_160065 [Fomitiporia mediterranea MF3/22]